MNKGIIFLVLVVLFGFTVIDAHAGATLLDIPAGSQAENNNLEWEMEPEQGLALCAPGAMGNCVRGPYAVFRLAMAEKGIQLPYQPVKYEVLDPSWGILPYQYGKVVTANAPVYGSAEAASRQDPVLYRLETGFNYISYLYTDVIDGVRVYMIAPGVWMNAIDVHRVGIPNFRGLTFQNTPQHPFGWILQMVESRKNPGYQASDLTGRTFNRLQIVEVYDFANVGNKEWVRIGPEDWIEAVYLAKVFPEQTPPPGVPEDRWIEINLYEQTVAAYENRRLVFATIISSGVDPYWTRPGLFQVYQKLDATKMTGAFAADRSDYYYLMDVPWTMYFDEARAIHGAYWHTFFGYPRSHGCVNLSPADSNWLYQWARVGDWVYVHDPSGTTPTDPSLYTQGGA